MRGKTFFIIDSLLLTRRNANKESDISAHFETRVRGKLTKPHPRAHQFNGRSEVYFSVWIERIPRASIDLDSDDR